MSFDWNEFIEVSKELLEEFGMDMLLVRDSVGEVNDPLEGTVTPGSVVSTTVRGVQLDISEDYIERNSSNGILNGDKAILLDPTTKPEETDKITILGQTWAIVAVHSVSPAGVDILYELQVRP
jgi:hypothetical protein